MTTESRDVERQDQLSAIVIDAIEEVNQLLEPGKRLPTEPDVPLADGGAVDSMSLVNLIVATEKRVEASFGVEISLAESMAEDNDAFATISSLVAYVDRLLEEAAE